jgi:hypothetical protein
MSNRDIQESVRLQQAISERLAEFAYADSDGAGRISRHIAEIATRGRSFAENTLPLFLQLPRDNPATVGQVALALKMELDELADTLMDLRRDLPDWTEFFSSFSNK